MHSDTPIYTTQITLKSGRYELLYSQEGTTTDCDVYVLERETPVYTIHRRIFTRVTRFAADIIQ